MEAIVGGTLADEAYRRISEALFTGTIQPGARLVMDDLAEKLGISRTPVRDALRRLERDGIIEHTGRKGFVTAAVDPDYRMHIYESRMAVEGFAARLAAKQTLTAQAHVASAIEAASNLELGSAKGSFEANRLVHRAVVEAARNPILLEAFDNLWDRGRSHQLYVNCFRSEDSEKLFREKHIPISEAIGTGNAEVAQAAMMQHLQDGIEQSLPTDSSDIVTISSLRT